MKVMCNKAEHCEGFYCNHKLAHRAIKKCTLECLRIPGCKCIPAKRKKTGD